MILGTVGIPTILLILLIAMPFIDVRAERHPLRRPVAMVAARPRRSSRWGSSPTRARPRRRRSASELLTKVPNWAKKQGFANNNAGDRRARKLFAAVGCLNCHTYLGAGNHNLGAPDLTAEGAKDKGIFFQIAHLKCPSCVNTGSPMPSLREPGEREPAARSRRSSRPRRARSSAPRHCAPAHRLGS